MRTLHLPCLLLLIAPEALGFVPASSTRTRSSPPSFFLLSSSSASTSADATATDAFSGYQMGQSNLAYKDESTGQGDSAVDGDVLKVSFVGRVFQSGAQFAKNDDFVFELGEGKTLPGFDTALIGTQAGTKRLIRVPPSMAYGKQGMPPRIPPNADLEFEIEVKEITRDKIQGKIAKFGAGRLLGMIACVAVLALSPMFG